MYQNPISTVDEHWKDNLIGLSFNKRLEKAIHQRARIETTEYLMDRFSRDLAKFCSKMHETVVVAALNKDRKILDISLNKPNDLILANFGLWLAAIIRAPSSSNTSFNIPDITNTSRTVYTYQIGGTQAFNGGTPGTLLQLGSGTTAAARADYKIQTALGTAPENTQFATSNGIYGGGSISFSASVSAGGSGTVTESGFFGNWDVYTYGMFIFMLFHDILASGVPYVAGNILPVSYSVQI